MPYRDHPTTQRPPLQRPPETVHATERLQVERKSLELSLRENSRGQFIRITEESAGRYNTIIIPASGATEFSVLLAGLTARIK